MKKSVSHYFKMFSIYTASAVAVGGFTYFVCSFIVMGGLLEIFLKLVVCTAMYNILLMLLYGRTVEYKEFMEKFDRSDRGQDGTRTDRAAQGIDAVEVMEKVMQQKTSRIVYLDVLKGVSMLLVIYCHGVLLPYHSVVGNLMMTLAWGAVPCFVMASGAVLHQSRHFTWQKHGETPWIYVYDFWSAGVCCIWWFIGLQERSPGFPLDMHQVSVLFGRITRAWIQVLCGI